MIDSRPGKIAKEAGITLSGEIYGGAARYFFILLLARLAGPQLLGLYSIANAITRLFGVIGLAGLDRGIMKFVSYNFGLGKPENAYSYINYALKIGIIMGLSVCGLQFLSASIINQKFYAEIPDLKNYLQLFSIILPFSILGGIAAFSTQGFQRLKYKVITIQVFQPSLLIIGLAGFYYLTQNATNLVKYPLLIAEISGFFLIMTFLFKLAPLTIKDIISASPKNDIIKFSLPLMFVGLFGMFMHWIDILMLGYFLKPEDVGIYHPAARTTGVIRMFLLAFGSIFSPMVSEFYAKGDLKEMSRIYKLTFRWIFILSLPFLIVCLTRPIEIMNMFGTIFSNGADVLVILVIGMMFQALGGLAAGIIVMTERARLALLNTVVATLVNISLNLWLIPEFGLIGAAISTTLTLLLLCITRILQVWRLLEIQPFQIGLWKPLFVFLIVMIFSLWSSNLLNDLHYFLNLCISMFITCCIIIGLFFILRYNEEDKLVFQEINNNLKRRYKS